MLFRSGPLCVLSLHGLRIVLLVVLLRRGSGLDIALYPLSTHDGRLEPALRRVGRANGRGSVKVQRVFLVFRYFGTSFLGFVREQSRETRECIRRLVHD